jgi:general stress protein 26
MPVQIVWRDKMNNTIDDAIKLLEETSTALLTTFIEKNKLDSRLIGPFVNDGLNVYIFTKNNSTKISQIDKEPSVSFYLQNKFENTKEYKSILINGKAIKITKDNEQKNVKDKLEIKSIGYKKWIDKDGWEKWTILRVQPELLKYTDNSKAQSSQFIEIK